MNCREFASWETEYLDGALDEGVRPLVESHLSLCQRCGRRVSELSNLSGMLRQVPWESTPPVLNRLVGHHIREFKPWSWRSLLRDACEEVIFNLRHLDRRLLWSKAAAVPITMGLFFSILANFDTGHSISYETYPFLVESLPFSVEQKSQAQVPELPFMEFLDATRAIAGEDEMTVLAVVSRRGNASIGNVVDYPRHQELFRAVRRNVGSTYFRPAVFNGQRVESYVVLSFSKIDVVG